MPRSMNQCNDLDSFCLFFNRGTACRRCRSPFCDGALCRRLGESGSRNLRLRNDKGSRAAGTRILHALGEAVAWVHPVFRESDLSKYLFKKYLCLLVYLFHSDKRPMDLLPFVHISAAWVCGQGTYGRGFSQWERRGPPRHARVSDANGGVGGPTL